MIVLYIFISFIVFFFTFKYYNPILQKRKTKWDDVEDFKEFWAMVFIPIFWCLSIPAIILWKILDYIYNKFINKNN